MVRVVIAITMLVMRWVLNQADSTINNRIDVLGDRLEQSFRNTNNRIDDVEKTANAGITADYVLRKRTLYCR